MPTEEDYWRYNASEAELELVDVSKELVKVKTGMPAPLDEVGGKQKIEVPSYWFSMGHVRDKAPSTSTMDRLWADRERLRRERKWGELAEQTCLLAHTWKKAWDEIYERELERKKNITAERHAANTKVKRLQKRMLELQTIVDQEKAVKAKRQKQANEEYQKAQEKHQKLLEKQKPAEEKKLQDNELTAEEQKRKTSFLQNSSASWMRLRRRSLMKTSGQVLVGALRNASLLSFLFLMGHLSKAD